MRKSSSRAVVAWPIAVLFPGVLLLPAAPAALARAPVAAIHRAAPPVTLLESGSSLLYPLFSLWIPAYTKAHSGIRITAAATGSGAGIADAENGTVQIGASDAYLPSGSPAGMENIALAISAQQVNFNLPGLNATRLHLNGPVLAGIYTGTITRWNAPQIQALNPGVRLPDHTIVPVHRVDGSGDTFLFTQYLTLTSPAWRHAMGAASYGTSISWKPVAAGVGATGNSGMVEALHANRYAIAYIGVSYSGQVDADHLGTAALESRGEQFLTASERSIAAAARSGAGHTPADESLSLVDAAGANAYPIVNYEYAVVQADQPAGAPSAQIRRFLAWCVGPGGAPKFLDQVGFVPLPASVRRLSLALIAKVR